MIRARHLAPIIQQGWHVTGYMGLSATSEAWNLLPRATQYHEYVFQVQDRHGQALLDPVSPRGLGIADQSLIRSEKTIRVRLMRSNERSFSLLWIK